MTRPASRSLSVGHVLRAGCATALLAVTMNAQAAQAEPVCDDDRVFRPGETAQSQIMEAPVGGVWWLKTASLSGASLSAPSGMVDADLTPSDAVYAGPGLSAVPVPQGAAAGDVYTLTGAGETAELRVNSAPMQHRGIPEVPTLTVQTEDILRLPQDGTCASATCTVDTPRSVVTLSTSGDLPTEMLVSLWKAPNSPTFDPAQNVWLADVPLDALATDGTVTLDVVGEGQWRVFARLIDARTGASSAVRVLTVRHPAARSNGCPPSCHSAGAGGITAALLALLGLRRRRPSV